MLESGMLEEWNTGRMGSKPNDPLLMAQKSMGNRGNDLKGKEEELYRRSPTLLNAYISAWGN
jgi:hypothetical protein